MDSSSDDECSVYINAAEKLKALKSRARPINENQKNEDNSDSDIIFNAEVKNDNKSNLRPVVESSKANKVIVLEDEPKFISNDFESNTNSNEPLRNRLTSRKKKEQITATKKLNSKTKESPIAKLDDIVEAVLNDSFNDSFLQTQEESKEYILIGSPLVTKKKRVEDDYEVTVKVLWRSNKIERFEIHRHETFQKIFKHFANLEGVHENHILITKRNKPIKPFDTPASIEWSIIDILDGGVVSADISNKNKGVADQENVCKIKIQTSDKKTLNLTLKPDEAFSVLIKNCSEQLKVPEAKIKLYFDGEMIDTDETPESLDIDDEACIDLKISK